MASRESVDVMRWTALRAGLKWVREASRVLAQRAWPRGNVLAYIVGRAVEGACDAALELSLASLMGATARENARREAACEIPPADGET